MKKIKIFESKVNESSVDLKAEIINFLNCSDERASEIIEDIENTKANFAINDKTVDDIWEQEKEYYKQFDCSAFDAGYQGKTLKTNKINESDVNPNDFTIQDIAELMTDSNYRQMEVVPSDLTPELAKEFNTEFNIIMNKYPSYNPYGDENLEADTMLMTLCDTILDKIQNPVNESSDNQLKNKVLNYNTMIQIGSSFTKDEINDYISKNQEAFDKGKGLEWGFMNPESLVELMIKKFDYQPNPVNESENDKSKEIKDVIASTTPDRKEKLEELNQHFVNLQNKGSLTPSEENQWKQISKALFGKVNESFDTSDIKQRLSNLSFAGLKSLCNDYEFGERILDTCESKEEIEDCLVQAFKDNLLDEIELIAIEDGEGIKS